MMTDAHTERGDPLDLGAELLVDGPQPCAADGAVVSFARDICPRSSTSSRAPEPPVSGSNWVRFRCTPNEQVGNFGASVPPRDIAGAFAMIVAEEMRPLDMRSNVASLTAGSSPGRPR